MNLIEKYQISVNGVPAEISIHNKKDEDVPIYDIKTPSIGIATKTFLESLEERFTNYIEIDEVTDNKKIEKVKQNFLKKAKDVLREKFPSEKQEKIDVFAGMLLHRLLGFGEVELVLGDDWLEEFAINGSKNNIAVYHKKYGWCKTNKKLNNEEEVYNFASQIGNKVNREINSLNPIMDAHLLTGDRVNATLFPVSTEGNTITIRRFARNPWTITHFIDPKMGTMNVEMAAFLWQCMQYEINVLIAGGTASGKTSMLNTLCSFIPPKQRVISIEDTREIQLPKQLNWNWVPLNSKQANPEGKGKVTMLDLMLSSLRMRPDRIIVGEVRKKEQVETMFEAMHTGHSVYTTMHADTALQVKKRLLEEPISISSNEVESLQVILVQYRDRRRGIRRTLELVEVLNQGNKEDLEINYLYRWHPRNDKFEKVNESRRIVEELNLHTGMTLQEIENDLREKKRILSWMLKYNIKNLDQVGNVMSLYYRDRNKLLSMIRKKP